MKYKPETRRKIEAVNKWQVGPFHELTCGIQSNHLPLAPRVMREKIGSETIEHVILVCVEPGCTYAQKWIPGVVFDA